MRRPLAGAARRPYRAAAAVALIIAVGTVGLPAAASAAALKAWSFVSALALQPPQVRVDTAKPGAAPGLVFIDPFKDFAVKTPEAGQPGGLILDGKGNPVWFHPVPAAEDLVNLEAQTYEGKPALTFWVGKISVPPATALPPGTPEPGGRFYIYDDHYRLIRTITPADGFTADPHEFTLTPQGTALFTAVKLEQAPVTTIVGTQQVKLVDSEVQEISLKTGKLVFSWDMLKHVSLTESQVPVPAVGGIWDPYHMNSIAENDDGDLIISARDTSALYDVSHKTGKPIWQLGGKGSTWKLGANASFSWQHDARFVGQDEITLFDDACCDLGVPYAAPEHASRGLILKLDAKAKTATVAHQYEHSPKIAVPSQGDMQTLPNGDEFIGWGQDPYYGEYTAAGKLLYEVTMPAADESYRALKYVWSAAPYYAPSIAAQEKNGRRTLYASWNGATGVGAWKVLAGSSPSKLKVVVAAATARGFETGVPVTARGPYFKVEALGAGDKVLRASSIVRLSEVAAIAHPRRAVAPVSATMIETSDHNRKLGRILAASNGHALYLFTKDTKGFSACTGTCTAFWAPLVAGSHVAAKRGSGINPKLLGTAKLSDSKRQVAYDRHPLYTYTGDRSDTTTAGEGADQFGGRWYVLDTKGNEVKPKQDLTNPCNPVCTGY
jgi:predicted lipoprotein with Yx(FWY)xxD motif